MVRLAAGLAPAMSMCAAAVGQVTPIAPFQGDHSDGFEMQCPCPRLFPCVPGGVFGGFGTLCADQGFIVGSYTVSCEVRPHSGLQFFGILGRPIEGATFTFSAPVSRFGAYFTQNHGGPGGLSVTFLDAGGIEIDRAIVYFDGDCQWRWQGWESSVPFSRVHVLGFRVSGPFSITAEFQIDDAEVAFNPASCYPDCDTSTGPGVLDIFDFLCFGNRFAANDPYACDCDVSTGPGVCDIFDFLCFGNAFAAGCP